MIILSLYSSDYHNLPRNILLACTDHFSSTGATRVFVFSHILRNDSRDKIEKAVLVDPALADDNAEVKDVTPARYIHIDQSYDGAVEVLNDNVHPPELAEKLAKTRWSIINVWRPIYPVRRVGRYI